MRENDFPGVFIVVEGIDGAGTTTQTRKLADYLDAYRTHENCNQTSDYSYWNRVGEKVEEMISDGGYSPEAVALGFASDRLIHLEEDVVPRLEEGRMVVSDRYYYSSLAYQTTMGADFGWVKRINSRAVRPDLTIILDVSADEGMERLDRRGEEKDIFENLDFQEEVSLRYRNLKDRLDDNIVYVDGSQSKGEVFEAVKQVVEEFLER
ncbi:MAG: dTMP kinase [Candidatus Nanohaloarchaeota archaeon QJJ-9]|nr:dTMP kinase [Candidatus Nanohaloarchaeota archaeon QJJ-9]